VRVLERAWIACLIACFVVLLMPANPAFGQDVDSARRFVESLYRRYTNHGKGIDLSGPKALNYFDASLNALMDADAKAVGPNHVGVLDGDPICSCQDWDGIWDLRIAVHMLSNNRARAAVSFGLFAPKAQADRDLRSLDMTLAWTGNQWRIDNILDRSDPKAPFDLRAELEREIRASKRDGKSNRLH